MEKCEDVTNWPSLVIILLFMLEQGGIFLEVRVGIGTLAPLKIEAHNEWREMGNGAIYTKGSLSMAGAKQAKCSRVRVHKGREKGK